MQSLGYTRSARRADHLLQTADTFIRAALPGMTKAVAIVHVGPAIGARFTQYTAEFEAGGSLAPAPEQRFIYVLEGELALGDRHLGEGHYAYLPPGAPGLTCVTSAHAAVIEKPYAALPGTAAPSLLTGVEQSIPPQAFQGDADLQVRSLLPGDATFDFAVNTMTFQPGATLPLVEIHVMEHGLLMLSGGGIYRLSDQWYPVTAGDFIYMAPYCPQWFGALGKTPAKYLIYKDWNRHPFA